MYQKELEYHGSKEGDGVVLFKSSGKGTCVYVGDITNTYVGEYDETWIMSYFEPFNGTLSLSNEQ